MQAFAKARFVRTSPRKARLVIDAIRGKYVDEALAILKFTPNYAARLIEKVVKSAAANAENNHHMNGEDLKVTTATVDGGPIMKRLRYAPMGRGYRIAKRLSHITVVVEEGEPRPQKKAKRKEVARTVRGRRQRPVAPKPERPKRQKAQEAEEVAQTSPVTGTTAAPAQTEPAQAPGRRASRRSSKAKGGQ